MANHCHCVEHDVGVCLQTTLFLQFLAQAYDACIMTILGLGNPCRNTPVYQYSVFALAQDANHTLEYLHDCTYMCVNIFTPGPPTLYTQAWQYVTDAAHK